jgi:hypothetical protein
MQFWKVDWLLQASGGLTGIVANTAQAFAKIAARFHAIPML